MTMPDARSDREYRKFTTDESGNVAVRTTAVLEAGDINVGSVEIKDADADIRVKVADGTTIGASDNAMAVKDGNMYSAQTNTKTSIDAIKDTDGIKKITDTVTVQATDLDVRDLDEASDGVAIYGSDDGGTTHRS